ncbi:hypothetical protein [Streptomyces sp. NPDC058620]
MAEEASAYAARIASSMGLIRFDPQERLLRSLRPERAAGDR